MSTLISVYDPRYVDRMPSEYLLLIDSQALTIRASSSYHLYISHDFATHSQPVVSLFKYEECSLSVGSIYSTGFVSHAHRLSWRNTKSNYSVSKRVNAVHFRSGMRKYWRLRFIPGSIQVSSYKTGALLLV